MSLRLRLFALFGSLLVLLVGAEWWLLRVLTRDLALEVGTLASAVGQDVIRLVLPTASGERVEREGRALPLPRGLPPSEAEKPRRIEVTERSELTLDGEDGQRRVVVRQLHTASGGASAASSFFSFSVPPPSGKASVLILRGPNVNSSIPIPLSGVGGAVGRFRGRLLVGSLGILGVGLLAAALIADRMSAPLRALSRTARRVGEGELGLQVGSRAGGEAGEAIQAFNRMSARLRDLERDALALKERQHLGELGEVARGLAHALRNPLHAVGLSIEELAALSSDERASGLADSARRQIRHVDQSIRSFLALANGGAGAEEELDAGELAEEVALTALHDARGRVRVTVERPSSPCRLRGIAAEVKAVLQALVVNAVEASPDGGSVAVRVAPAEGGGAAATVEDAGTGLPVEVRERLFTPHVTTKPAGSGMGLFLAHRIATTRYGGRLELLGREPHGTRAVLLLMSREASRG